LELRRLHPDPAPVTIERVAGSLGFADQAPADRPYLIANMVATADGRSTIGERSGPIGGDADHAFFHALRGQVDAVLVGTGTLRAERYGRLVRDPAAREARAGRGLKADPIACVVSRSGHIPFDIPLFQDPASTIALYTLPGAMLEECPADVRVTRMQEGELGMGAALRGLRSEHGCRSVLCEGGPTVLAALLAEGLVDELFLTVAPVLAGGEGALRILAGQPLPEPVAMRLVWVLESDGDLLLRYRVDHSEGAASA